MVKIIEVNEGVELQKYDLYPTLTGALREMYAEAAYLIPILSGRKIWMVNSTSIGGGVAEMMPRMISFFRQLGLEADWIVAGTENKLFFTLTKKIHNLIHNEGTPNISNTEKEIYETHWF